MKKVLSLMVLLVAMGVMFAGCGRDEGVLVMATSADFPPFEFINDAGEFDGFDVHMARAIADALGMELQIDDMAFDGVILSVYTGATDVAIAAITVTEERAQSVAFSIPYFQTALVAIVAYDSPITSTDQLHEPGTAIAVQLGTTSDIMVEWYLPYADVTRMRTATDTIMELSTGRSEAIVIDRGVAAQFIDSHDGLRMLPETLAYEEYAIAVSLENTELLADINSALQQLMDSGELQRIYDMFFGGE